MAPNYSKSGSIDDSEYLVQGDNDDSSVIFDTIRTDLESVDSKKTPVKAFKKH